MLFLVVRPWKKEQTNNQAHKQSSTRKQSWTNDKTKIDLKKKKSMNANIFCSNYLRRAINKTNRK